MSQVKRIRVIITLSLLFLTASGIIYGNSSFVDLKGFYDYDVFEVEQKSIPTPGIYGSNGEVVGIIVDPAIWAVTAAQTAINQYIQDLNYTGYTVLLDSTGAVNIVTLKNKISFWYTTYGISGVCLIGNLPYAQYYHPAVTDATWGSFSAETFICELFLTDLDGNWTDSNSDTVYDIHNAGNGDIYPEIYLGRIDATSRTLGGLTNAQDIINQLTKIHNYYIGVNLRPHQALTFIDDDWQLWADGTYDNWPGWLNNLYSSRTDIHTPTTATTNTTWLTYMTQNYEFVHLAAHSGSTPAQHYFGPGGVGEGTVTSTQIHSTTPAANFYNLYCCKGADYAVADCLATTYLFSGSNTVSVVATSKTGGMNWLGNYFYDPLSQDKTIGKALQDWYNYVAPQNPRYLEWYYGMLVLGDPFATTDYDCTVYPAVDISSSTHPDQESWYTSAITQVNWSAPIDVNGITGYYIVVDTNPLTEPTTSSAFISTNGYAATMTEGTWYIHVVAVDGNGNLADAVHYEINIDTTDPTVSISSPLDNSKEAPGTITLTWTAGDATSGYSHADISVDSTFVKTVDGPTLTTTLAFPDDGTYTIEVKAYDEAGLSSTDSITITVQNFFKSMTFYIIVGAGGGTVILIVAIVIIVAVRRKKV